MSLSKMLLAVVGLLLFAGFAVAQDPVPLYPQNYKVLLENERVRVLDFQLKQGARKTFMRIRRRLRTCWRHSRFASLFPTAAHEFAKRKQETFSMVML